MDELPGPEQISIEQNSMIENARKTHVVPAKDVQSAPAGPERKARVRRLNALEIAEGALLADIAVVFQLLIRYLPIGGNVIMVLTPVVFAVLVLRRGLYAGCMSLCVALFIVSIVIGPGSVPFMLLETGAGLFLGLTMRYRLNQTLTVVSGVIGGGVAFWAILLSVLLLTGRASLLVRSMRRTYIALTPLLSLLFGFVHLGGLWQHTLFPALDNFMQWGFQNWPALLLLTSCLSCIPVVIAVYLIVNLFLRLLGYQVRPFPGYRLEGLLYGLAYRLLMFVPAWALARIPVLYSLKRELRRLNIARLRQQRVEKEAREAV